MTPARAGRWDGAILVGGLSRRMGRDKARLRVGGVPLWRRQALVVEAAGAARVSLVLRRGQRAFAWSGNQVRDGVSDAGPLAGIVAALSDSRKPWLFVVAVDLGNLTPETVRRLFRHCRPGRGAVFRGERGHEPLAAFYPLDALPILQAALVSSDRALQPVIRRLVGSGLLAAVIPAPGDERSLSNWNRLEDMSVRPRLDAKRARKVTRPLS